jgi:ABC-type glycerol-3-phosphate transport system permease component
VRLQTLVVGVTRIVMQRCGDEFSVNPIGRAMAGGVMLVLPLLVVFLFANRYFTSALGGAVKG